MKTKPGRFWSTIILIALIVPIPLSLGMGLLTGVFSHSANAAMKSIVSYYVIWFIVDAASIGWIILRNRKEL